MSPRRRDDPRLARTLVLDELFDLSLYRALRHRTDGDLRKMLDELVGLATKAIWGISVS